MKKELVKLANHLDNIGHRDLADRLDGVLKTAGIGSSIFEAAKQISSSDEPRDENGDISIHPDQQKAWNNYEALREDLETRVPPGSTDVWTNPVTSVEEDEGKSLSAWEVEHPHFVTKYEEEHTAEDPLVKPEEQEGAGTFLSYRGEAGSIDPQTIPPLQLGSGGSPQSTEGNPAFDGVIAANSAEDRINKLAELMSSEFTTNVTGVFRR